MAKDQPAGFGDFVLSLVPLMLLVGIGLGTLHFTNGEMPVIGAILLTCLSLIPLSIGPIFLILVAYGKGMVDDLFAIAIAFNRLRLKLVLPVFILVLAWILDRLPDVPSLVWAGLGALYFLFCLWCTTRLVARYLNTSTSLSVLVAIGALCLAVL